MTIDLIEAVFELEIEEKEEELLYLDKELVNLKNQKSFLDILLKYGNVIYHFEAEFHTHDICRRMIQYGMEYAQETAERIEDRIVLRIPTQAVIYLTGVRKKKKAYQIGLSHRGKQKTEYQITAVYQLGYTAKELSENGMELLLPFQVIRYYRPVRRYDEMNEKKREELLRNIQENDLEIFLQIKRMQEEGRITKMEAAQMLEAMLEMHEYIYRNIQDWKGKGVEQMLQERFRLPSEILEEESEAKGRREGRREGREEGISEGVEIGIKAVITLCKDMGLSIVDAIEQIGSKFDLPEEISRKKVQKYW